VPAGRGLWPAFWLLPANQRSLPEIDVMEILGDKPATVHMHFHYRGRGGRPVDKGNTWTSPGLAAGWHRFAIDWRPGVLRWLIDGTERFRITGSSVPDVPMYLVANLAVGGDWPGSPDRETPFPSVFKIDYIRVWP
jgi:beta-glucanase (GH16 family)